MTRMLRGSFGLMPWLLALPAVATAATASLVADLNTTGPHEQMSFFSPGLSLGDRVLFTAFERSSGTELWTSDGTVHGTRLLRDWCPGECWGGVSLLGRAGRKALLRTGGATWLSDGTRSGTVPLTSADGRTVRACTPLGLTSSLGSSFFFQAAVAPASTCDQLWRTDGTREGTVALRDLTPNSRMLGFVAVGATAFFLIAEPGGSDGLWRSDGTATGTQLVQTVDNPGQLLVAGTRLFFVSELSGATELWTSDGTGAGTRPLLRLPAPFSGTALGSFHSFGGKLYFLADGGPNGIEIWRSDGTTAGTRAVTDFVAASPFGAGVHRLSLAGLGNRLLFIANDGSGNRLWTSDGTPATTRLLASCPGACPGVASGLQLAVFDDEILFQGHDPQHGWELWASDGTAGGTRLARDLCPGSCSGLPRGMVLLRDQVWFEANAPDGASVWRTDGTAQGTVRLVKATRIFSGIAILTTAVEAAGKVFFAAVTEALGTQLWASDGTPAGSGLATRLEGSGPSARPEPLTRFGRDLLFWACAGAQRALWRNEPGGTVALPASAGACGFGGGSPRLLPVGGLAFFRDAPARVLWRTDGTAAGTFPLGPSEADSIGDPVAWGAGKVAFLAVLDFRASLWESDGTPAGTSKLIDLPVELAPEDLQSVGGKLYFRATSGGFNQMIWTTDGTVAGTRRLVTRAANFGLARVVPAGNTTFILFPDAVLKTDGTPEGTLTVRELPNHVAGLLSSSFVDFGGSLYFTALGTGGRGLWRSDGTFAGTSLIKLLGPDADPLVSEPALFTPLGATLYFVVDDGEHGRELWRTDGTAAGTLMVHDLVAGPGSSSPESLVAAGGRLYFSAAVGDNGRELWTSDGTAVGMQLVQDLAPEGLSSAPRELTVIDDQLFFSADDGFYGRELWVYPLDAPPGCVASGTVLCLGDGRFQVTAEWLDFAGNRGPGRAVPLTADTGTFWFFDPANVEVILKVLDGAGVNGHRWVFYGALSSVEYTLTVTDTQTGAARRYRNLLGRLTSVADTSAFGPDGAHATGLSLGPQAASAFPAFMHRAAVKAEPCAPSSQRLCLNQGRFAVEARWKDFAGNTGTAGAVPLGGGDTGYFWFFDPNNVEVVLKVLDGRPVNGKFWVFYGALSTVEYTLTVTDTETGQVRTFTNPAGRLASVAETRAF